MVLNFSWIHSWVKNKNLWLHILKNTGMNDVSGSF